QIAVNALTPVEPVRVVVADAVDGWSIVEPQLPLNERDEVVHGADIDGVLGQAHRRRQASEDLLPAGLQLTHGHDLPVARGPPLGPPPPADVPGQAIGAGTWLATPCPEPGDNLRRRW